MYYKHFGLNQPPFKITPDTRLFFPGANRGAVLQALVYAIVNGEGIVKVVGEVGSGKTMLCRMLEVELPENVEVVYLANPSVAPEHILHAIAFELKLPVSTTDDRLRVLQSLQDHLLKKHADNRRVVVFIEEAQSMPVATLEEIRLLSNLETGQDKLLQIVLFGQPELDRTLARHDIRQLKERITYSFYLTPFNAEEIHDYVNSRLRASGHRAGAVFSRRAVRNIGRYSRGLVRRVNIIADKSMLAAYAGGANTVTHRHVHTAARDSEFEVGPLPVWAVAAALLLALGGGGLWWWQQNRTLVSEAVAMNEPAAPSVPTATEVSPVTAIAPDSRPGAVAMVEPPSEPPAAAPAEEPLPEVNISLNPEPTPANRIDEEAGGGITVPAAPASQPADPIRAQLLSAGAEEPVVAPLVDIETVVSLLSGAGSRGAEGKRQ